MKTASRLVAITVPFFGRVSQTALRRLRAKGFQVRRNTFSRALTVDETLALARGASGVIAGVEVWDRRLFSVCPHLKVISRIGVGLDKIDLQAARRRGIKIFTTPDPVAQPVAEMVLAMILSLLRQLPDQRENMARGIWKPLPGRLLSGKTLGVIGLGRIGRRLVEIAKAFGVRLLICDPKPDRVFVRESGARLVALGRLLSESDIVSLHLPYDSHTKHFMNSDRFGMMKRGAIFVNTARGGLVDTQALIRHLRSGWLGGACLDVFEKEPYRGLLSRLAHVIATPHVASFTEESWDAMENDAVANLLKALPEK